MKRFPSRKILQSISILSLFFILQINLYSQSFEGEQYKIITQQIDSLISLPKAQYMHIDNKILNKNGRDIGFGNDNFYWTGDSLLKITSEYYTRFKSERVTIYYKSNYPIYYQINKKEYSQKNLNPKKVFKIDCNKEKVYQIKKNRTKASFEKKSLINYCKNQMEYWNEIAKDYKF